MLLLLIPCRRGRTDRRGRLVDGGYQAPTRLLLLNLWSRSGILIRVANILSPLEGEGRGRGPGFAGIVDNRIHRTGIGPGREVLRAGVPQCPAFSGQILGPFWARRERLLGASCEVSVRREGGRGLQLRGRRSNPKISTAEQYRP